MIRSEERVPGSLYDALEGIKAKLESLEQTFGSLVRRPRNGDGTTLRPLARTARA